MSKKARHFCTVFTVFLVKLIEKEDVRDVDEVAVYVVPVKRILGEVSVCASVLKECALAGYFIAHDVCKRSRAFLSYKRSVHSLVFHHGKSVSSAVVVSHKTERAYLRVRHKSL